jgi:tetratricopeptide (TPR) repeat protein
LLYKEQGKDDQALGFFQETVRIRDQGQESEELATALNNLARVLRDQKRYSEAEPLYKRALAIREKAFGPNHESVAAVLRNYAILLKADNRAAEAKVLNARARKIEDASPDGPSQ